jgi:hypothetical protein
MKFSTITTLLINAYGASAFISSPTNNAGIIYKTKTTTGTQLFYHKDETGVETLDVATLKVTYALKEVGKDIKQHTYTYDNDREEEDDFVDPMEEAFDNMQHPMELMLLSRAC